MSEADARIFVAVAQAGSFVAAATLYGMTPSSVSKAIGRLEELVSIDCSTSGLREIAGVFERGPAAARLL